MSEFFEFTKTLHLPEVPDIWYAGSNTKTYGLQEALGYV